MNNKPLPSRFSVKPLAFLIPIASLSLASAYVNAQFVPTIGNLVTDPVSQITVVAGESIATNGSAALSVNDSLGGGASVNPGIVIEDRGAIIAGTYSSTIPGTGILITNGAQVGSITNAGTISGASISSLIGGGAVIVSNNATLGSLNNSNLIFGDIKIIDGGEVTGGIENSGGIFGSIDIVQAEVEGNIEIVGFGSVAGGINNGQGGLINGNIIASGLTDSSMGGASVGSVINAGVIDGSINISGGAQVIGAIDNSGFIDGNSLSEWTAASGEPLPDMIVSNSFGGDTYSGAGIAISAGAEVGSVTNSGVINGSNNFGQSGGDAIVVNNATLGSLTNSGPGFFTQDGVEPMPGDDWESVPVPGDDWESVPVLGDGWESGPVLGDGIGLIDGNILISNGGQVTGVIDNSGMISGKVIVEGLLVQGEGVVHSSVGSLTNSGIISGVRVSQGARVVGAIDNSGFIDGNSLSEWTMNSVEPLPINPEGDMIVSNSFGGDTYSGAGIAISAGAEVGSVTNSGVVNGSGSSEVDLSGPSGSAAIVVSNATLGSLTNSGPGFFTQDGIAPALISGDGSELAPGDGFGLIDGDILILGSAEVTGIIDNGGVINGSVIVEGTSFNGKGGDPTSVGSLTNSGLISGVRVSQGARVDGAIDNSGLIGAEEFFGGSPSGSLGGSSYSGAGIAISSGAEVGSVTNSGVVSGSGSSEFELSGPSGSAAIVVNNATLGSLTNNALGEFGPGLIDGHIAITRDGQVTGAIDNRGVIRGSVIVSGDTYSVMGGGPADTSVGSIVNSGQIFGGIEVSEGAAVIGAIANNDGFISAGSYSGSGGAAITISGDANVGSLTNSGKIEAGSYSGAAAIMISSGAELGSLTNSGLIQAESYSGNGAVAIIISGGAEVGSLTNTGTIDDGIEGNIQISSGSQVTGAIDNDGRIIGSIIVNSFVTRDTVAASSVGSIANDGTIEGNIQISGGSQVTGEISNSGLIQGNIDVDNSSFNTSNGPSSIGSLANSGTIDGEVYVSGGAEVKGDVVNSVGGKINAGISFEGGSTFGGNIENAGVITLADSGEGYDDIRGTINIDGVPYSESPKGDGVIITATVILDEAIEEPEAISPIVLEGKIVNTGEISNTSEAVPLEEVITSNITKPSVAVTDPAAIYLNNVNMLDGIYNEGSISSTSGTGIRVDNGSVNTIANEGTISGGNGYAIFIDDTATLKQLDNSGTITGMVDFGVNGGLYKATGGTSGEIVNASALEIGAATAGAGPLVSTINGDFSFSGPMTFDANGFDGGISYGQLSVSDDATIEGSIAINVTGETFFSNNDVLELIKAGGSLTTDIDSAEDNSLLLDFTIATDASSLFATVEREEAASVVESLFAIASVAEEVGLGEGSAGATNAVAVAAALDQVGLLIESGDIPEDSELGEYFTKLQAIEDPVELVRAIKALESESGGGASEGSFAAAGAVSAVIANRQASLRNSLYETGMVAGDDIAISGFWIQGYDKDTEQDTREGVDGYDVDMYGIALGADAPINERTTVGVAISYADSQVDSTGIESNEMAIDSYQISSYVSFNEDDYYLDALVSYARNDYDGKRYIDGLTANSDYSGDQYGLRARGGYPFVLESGIHVTPNTSVEYSYLKEETYSETGAGNLANETSSETLEALVWAAGVKVSYPFTTESDVTWMPDFHIEVRHDFIGDEVELDSNFVGVGGAGFSTNGASVETTAYKAGVGLRAWSQSSLSFMFRYDYTYKQDYNSQAVAATMRFSF